MAADSNLTEKKWDTGELRLCLVYQNDWRNAKLSAEVLHSRLVSDIRGIKIQPEFISFSDILSARNNECSGIFLAQPLPDEKLVQLIEFAYEKNIVLFSPFEGDVERGVLGGIKVESRVLPYLNATALKKSKIKLKSFFMKVAKVYEE